MSKRKLLLADDSVTIQKVVNLTFADEGIEVITVGDGDSALEKISEVSPDVVLADVHMPGLNGYQICEIVRENPATRNLPVVLLVGSFEPFDENEAARVGANAFLTKPFQSIRQLVTQVSDLMEMSSDAGVEDNVSADNDGNLPAPAPLADVQDDLDSTRAAEPHDTSDIESLYHQSFGAAATETADSPYSHSVDVGMDDEMIETIHGGVAPAETEYARQDFSADSDFEERAPREDEYRKEPSMPSPFDTIADEDDSEPFVGETPREESYFDQFAETEKIPNMKQQVSEAVASFELDEIDLLELPPIENGKTVEFTTKENMADQATKKQVMSLSPELMDMIVQKVVEKLSEK